MPVSFRNREREPVSHSYELRQRGSVHFSHYFASVRLHRDLADTKLEANLFIQAAGDN